MKKLTAFIVVIMFLLCGCSLIGQSKKAQSLAEKLGQSQENTEKKGAKPKLNLKSATGTEKEPIPEATVDPYSPELFDAYNIRSFWENSMNIDSFISNMGLSYNAKETERISSQVDFKPEIYTAPYNHLLPATDKSECYAYTMADGNVFRFDYKYYVSPNATPEEVADTYFAAVDAMGKISGKAKDLELYNEVTNGFSYDDIIIELSLDSSYISFRTGFGATSGSNDYTGVMLLKRDGILSIITQWILPAPDATTAQNKGSASASNESTSGSSQKSNAGNEVTFIGIVNYDDTSSSNMDIVLSDMGAKPDGNGGYDCFITLTNNLPYMTKIAIDVWLFGGYEEADIITLAEPAAFNSGTSDTFEFKIPGKASNGYWEVLVEYRFW